MIEPPLIRCRPTPSDAELEADLDRKHARVMADYWADQNHDWPITEVTI